MADAISYTKVYDRAVRKLGLIRGYALCLVARNMQMERGQFDAGIENTADALGLGRNRLRRAIHWLRKERYIADKTPDRRHRPHEYELSAKGFDLLGLKPEVFQNGRPKTGDLKQETRNRRPKTADESTESKSTSGKSTSSKRRSSSTAAAAGQMTLVEDRNYQNLGGLDIEAQRCLDILGIRADLKQSFKSAPDLIKKYTPAEILMFHDDDGEIAVNLGRWRAAWDAGAEITAKPALIWAKIVEGQEPPEPREGGGWYEEAEEAGILVS